MNCVVRDALISASLNSLLAAAALAPASSLVIGQGKHRLLMHDALQQGKLTRG